METMNRDSQNSSGTNYPVKKAKTVFVILGYLCCLLGGYKWNREHQFVS